MFKTDQSKAYGCIFCVTGKERSVARLVERACDVRTIVARQQKYKTVQGVSLLEEKILYPGYIFLETQIDTELFRALPKDADILTVLRSESGDWRLYGNDEKLVGWLFSYDGLLPISQARKEGDWVRIASGPLLDLSGQIVRFDKHHKSAQVAVTFCNRPVKFWLNFEILERTEIISYKREGEDAT